MRQTSYFLQLFGFYPSVSSICQVDATPAIHRAVGDVDTRSLMNDELVGALSGRSLLDIDRRSHDDGARAVDEYLFLLIGKERTQEEDDKEEDAAEEAGLAQQQLGCEEIDQHQYQGKDDGQDARLGPVVDTGEVDQRLVPGDEEHLADRSDLIDGLAASKLQVEVDVLVAGRQQMGTFVSQDSLGDVVGAIIGIAEVVVDLGRNTVLE